MTAVRAKTLPGKFKNLLEISKTASNSTSSLYIANLMCYPKVKQIITCVAKDLCSLMKPDKNTLLDGKFDVLFSERFTGSYKLPTQAMISRFMREISESKKLEAEIVVTMGILVRRFIQQADISLLSRNFKRVLAMGLLLATKLWDDDAVWTSDFHSHFPRISLKDVNSMELFFLKKISYDVHISAADYAAYYFKITGRDPSTSTKRFTTNQKRSLEIQCWKPYDSPRSPKLSGLVLPKIPGVEASTITPRSCLTPRRALKRTGSEGNFKQSSPLILS